MQIMQPRKFFETATHNVPSAEGITFIGPLGTDFTHVTHQIAITARSTTDSQSGKEQESITVWTADTNPHNNDAYEFSFTLDEGAEPQVEDIHSGDTLDDEPELHLRDVATYVGTATVKVFQSKAPSKVTSYIGTVDTFMGSFLADLRVANPFDEPESPDFVTADSYADFYEHQIGIHP